MGSETGVVGLSALPREPERSGWREETSCSRISGEPSNSDASTILYTHASCATSDLHPNAADVLQFNGHGIEHQHELLLIGGSAV